MARASRMLQFASGASFDRNLLLGLASGAVLLAIVLFLSYRSVGQVRITSARAHHTEQVRLTLEAVGQTILNIETGQRGYIITSQEEYLEPYTRGHQVLDGQMEQLARLISGDPVQSSDFLELQRLLEQRQQQMTHALELHAAGGYQHALTFITTNRGHVTMQAIRELLNRMSAHEVQELEARAASERESLRRNFFFIVTLSIAAVGLLLTVYLLIRREIAVRARAARELDAVNAGLEARVAESTRALSQRNAMLEEEVALRKATEAELQKERALLEARVQERTAELVAASQSKSRFLSAASHDLRQPLHSLTLLNGALLRGQALSGTAREIAEAQRQSIESMSQLVHALLNISMLESGVIQPQIGDVRLAEILETLRAEFEPPARGKGLRLEWATDSGRSIFVRSDPTLLREILQNLLANAIRYTHSGEVRLALRDAGRSLAIDVSDTGAGIPADKLELIFEEFHQLRADGREREGFGLGLAIVRQLVKLLGVELKVQSVVGQGTTFTLVVPLAMQQGLAPEAPATDKAVARRARILLIDDEPPVLSATELFLGIEGHKVVAAGSPEEALARWQEMEQMPDVIVSDYQLGTQMTGVDLIEKLRALAQRAIPALILSGDMLRVARRCAGIENCRVFHKPVDAEELAQHIQAMMEASSPRVDLRDSDPALRDSRPGESGRACVR